MPSKHIDEKTWDKVKDQFVRAVILTKTSLKETDILKLLINKGVESIKDEDYIKYVSDKNQITK